MTCGILFPHQLFEQQPLLSKVKHLFLLEEFLFFKQYAFHQQKLVFHRASMKRYAEYLKDKCEVEYLEATDERSDVRKLIASLQIIGIKEIHFIDPTDDWLKKRVVESGDACGISCIMHASPLFMNKTEENECFFADKKRMFQTDYYIHQRKKRKILVDDTNNPIGGKWSFDTDNRKKYPAKKTPPSIPLLLDNKYEKEARSYIEKHFSHHYGDSKGKWHYPISYDETRAWLQQFLKERFAEFGDYEDAIVGKEYLLHHSMLAPMLNTGLISPEEVIETTLVFANQNNIPLNTLEGFIRQVIGWREFIRAVYERKGKEERICNYWQFKRKIPESFWNGTTGIQPFDLTVQKVLQTGYCHHIERLMVLGNLMLLCEFDPDEVYRWFMTLFIDAYDWVMVPNVYGMSQFADGGLMATKPYISGSNYLMKMSDYEKGDWQLIWDALFWRFMHVHRSFFLQNPRLGMLVHSFDKMETDKKNRLMETAEKYLLKLEHSETKKNDIFEQF